MTANTPEGQRILGTLRSEDGVGVVRIGDRFDADKEEADRCRTFLRDSSTAAVEVLAT